MTNRIKLLQDLERAQNLLGLARDEIIELINDRDRWRHAAQMGQHFPTHKETTTLRCKQCRSAIAAYVKAEDESTHPLDNIDWEQEMLNDAQ